MQGTPSGAIEGSADTLEGPVTTSQLSFFSTHAPEAADVPATDYRLFGRRALASGWKARALDNIVAVELSKRIESEGRPATDEEKDQLIKFVGFGATELATSIISKPFRAGWEKIGTRLHRAITAEELKELARATQYAHYTPEFIIKAMWKGMRRLGFTGGAVLEPGCGTGLFLALMPEGMKSRSTFLGVEACSVTARISRLLYPESDIWCGDFTRETIPPAFDLAIGNPPFSSVSIQGRDEIGKLGLSLHDYFIARSIDALRPGGLAAFVVSRYTMDKSDTTAREFIADRADLLGAIRMPHGAMSAEAGTEVVVDLLFFQRRETLLGADAARPEWVNVGPTYLSIDGKPAHINEYFLSNPHMMLGEGAIVSSQHGPTWTCKGSVTDLDILLADAIRMLPEKIYQPTTLPRPAPAAGPRVRIGTAADRARIKEGSYFVQDDTLFQVIDGAPMTVQVKDGKGTEGIFKKTAKIIRGMIGLRDAVRDILAAQEADLPWQEHQARLRTLYAGFVHEFGPVNLTTVSERPDPKTGEPRQYFRYPNVAAFRDDPDCPLVQVIEDYDPTTGIATKGPIFTDRVISPPTEVIISCPADALVVVLNELGKVNLGRIGELLGVPEPAVISALGDLIYLNPSSGEWETADAYLSGNVRRKLAEAKEAAATDHRLERNVKALQEKLPVDLLPSEITARLGASWIPVDVIEAFSLEVLKIRARVFHTPEIGLWSVDAAAFKSSAAALADWGTRRRHAGDLLLDALTSNIPQIYDTIRDINGEVRVLNVKETQAAQDKLAAIKEAFSEWVWKEPKRADRLAGIYNETFNNIVPRSFDGSHLVLPGASDTVQLRQHQKRGAWRMVCAGSTYLSHVVGAGKTMCLIAGCMEQKRLGLITKPMIVVPGHTLYQWAREFLQLYPNANILLADEENFSKEKRKRFVARAATGNWDAVIITHSAFKFISVPTEFEAGMIEAQLDTYDEMLEHADKSDRTSVKKLERLKEGLQRRLDALSAIKDDLLTIGEMGVDSLVVDEAQQFRKLPFPTNMSGLKGVDPEGSQRAWDLYVKSKYLDERNPGRALFMASGTPITNTMGELFTLLRFMNEPALFERNIQYFDAWASCFGETKTELELQPSGQYKAVTRFSQFVNIPELTSMFLDVADVVLSDDLAQFVKLPAILGGQRKVLTFDGGSGFRAAQKLLATRLEKIKQRSGKPQKGDDIILTVINDGRLDAIDLRQGGLANSVRVLGKDSSDGWYTEVMRRLNSMEAFANNPGNKLNGMIDNVISIWRETANDRFVNPANGEYYPRPGGAQMIFCDIGTPATAEKHGFSAYDWIVRRLVAAGIPREEIAVIHDFNKLEAKLRLFSAVNQGSVRILLGSSEKMGTGVNAQQRLVAMHHLDAPWLPALVEQREGRIRRQGNQNETIRIFAYATLGSMDATMWQILERKMRFIDAVMRGDKSVRRLDDLDTDSQADQFAMAKAMASGDDRLMQKAGLEVQIARLQRQRAAYYDAQSLIRREIKYAEESLLSARSDLEKIAADEAIMQVPEPFSITVAGEVHTERKPAAESLMGWIRTADLEKRVGTFTIGDYAGFKLEARGSRYEKAKGELGYALTLRVMRTGLSKGVYDMDISDPLSLLRRIEHAVVPGIADHRAQVEMVIEAAEKRIAEFKPRISDAPFDHQADLDEKQERLREIEESLAASEQAETQQEQKAA
jgi:N12 class adenine-specific DNA methylase